MDTIKINDKTKNTLKEINTAIMQLQSQATSIVQTYLDALGLDGNYQLSKDLDKLIKQEASDGA